MFDFFKKSRDMRREKIEKNDEESKKEDETLENVDASIVFHVTRDGQYFVDFEISNLEEETIDNLGKLLIEISRESFYLEMLEIVKSGFEKQGRGEIFTDIAKKITEDILHNLTSKEIFHSPQISVKNEEKPCFKPSDML